MDFGLSIVTQFEPSRDLQSVSDELLTQVEIAADSDIDLIHVGEHHATNDQYLLNETVLAYLATRVGATDIGPGVCLLPYHNPVRIAEFGATLDVLTGGQFRLGVAQGYRDVEFDVFGVTRENAVGRLVEGIEIIKRLWTEDTVSFDGEHFQLDEVSINPKPVQDPRPPILMGASNESSIRRAARIADGWWGAHAPIDVLSAQVDHYLDERERVGLDDGRIRINREVFVAESEAEALDAVREPLLRKYGSYSEWGQDDVFDKDTFHEEWAELSSDRFIVGTPSDVATEIERYRDTLGLDGLGARMRFKGMKFDDVLSSLQLYCNDVLPAVS